MYYVKAQKNPFHLVPKSPWPLTVSFSILLFLLGMVLYFHYFYVGLPVFFFGLFSLLFFLTSWFSDVILESFKGHHTSYVANGLSLGFILMIVSEVMFFFSFFWSYFHLTFSSSLHTGGFWPYVKGPYPWALPFLNTMILSLSSLTLTEAHKYFLEKTKGLVFFFMFMTMFLGLFFTYIQGMEYFDSPLTFNNGSLGSIFYMVTGFHGMHVFMGTIFLMVTTCRLYLGHFLFESHLLLEISSLYWHFVDVIWFLLFYFVYIWGGF